MNPKEIEIDGETYIEIPLEQLFKKNIKYPARWLYRNGDALYARDDWLLGANSDVRVWFVRDLK